jgi:flagellar protein FliS
MNSRGYAQQYKQTSVASAVLNASPHKQVSLLLKGTRDFIRRAIACIEVDDIPRKGEAISRASAIIAELDATLNHDAGGEVAASLAQLYDYCMRRLVTANVHNDVAILQEVDTLIGKIESSWNAIGETATAA